MQRTPFYHKLLNAGAKMVEFAGYEMPVQFESTGILAEHKAVREAAGLFDVSHMGELTLGGKGALATLQNIITNDISNLPIGKVRYTLLPNEQGGVIDDILIYRMGENDFFLVLNAANAKKDTDWIKQHLLPETTFHPAEKGTPNGTAQLALQGPKAYAITCQFIPMESIPAKYYTCGTASIEGNDIIISRTGYTGEDGFEFYCKESFAERLFDIIMQHGKGQGLVLAGLGARDTLRMEAAMPLYGHEMNDETLCTEIGLDFAIKMSKPGFIGKEALEKNQPKYKRMGIKMLDRGIAREHFKVFDPENSDRCIGYVTSGTFCPTLNHAVAMIRVEKDFNAPIVLVEVRNKKLKAEILTLPFYKRKKS